MLEMTEVKQHYRKVKTISFRPRHFLVKVEPPIAATVNLRQWIGDVLPSYGPSAMAEQGIAGAAIIDRRLP